MSVKLKGEREAERRLGAVEGKRGRGGQPLA